MGYAKIDSILKKWADIHNLPIYKVFKEEEIRSFEITGSKGKRYQIWVDVPDKKEQIGIHLWDFQKRRKNFFTQEENLFDCLETALLIINQWKSE